MFEKSFSIDSKKASKLKALTERGETTLSYNLTTA